MSVILEEDAGQQQEVEEELCILPVPAPPSKAAKAGRLISEPAWVTEEVTADALAQKAQAKANKKSKRIDGAKRLGGNKVEAKVSGKARPMSAGSIKKLLAQSDETGRQPAAPAWAAAATRPRSAGASSRPPSAGASSRPASAGALRRPASAAGVRGRPRSAGSSPAGAVCRLPESWHDIEVAKVHAATAMTRCELMHGLRLDHAHAMGLQDKRLRHAMRHRGSTQHLERALHQGAPQAVQQLRSQCEVMRQRGVAVAKFHHIGQWVSSLELRSNGKEALEASRQSSMSAFGKSKDAAGSPKSMLEGRDMEAEVQSFLEAHEAQRVQPSARPRSAPSKVTFDVSVAPTVLAAAPNVNELPSVPMEEPSLEVTQLPEMVQGDDPAEILQHDPDYFEGAVSGED